MREVVAVISFLISVASALYNAFRVSSSSDIPGKSEEL